MLMRVAPSWYILSYLQLIPQVSDPNCSFRTKCRKPRFCFRLVLVTITFTYLFAMFLHDVINLFFNKSFWITYMANTNKIITLLILLKPLAMDWKNGLAFLLFAYKSPGLSAFIFDITKLIQHLGVTDRQKIRHQITFVVCYCVPVILNIFRVTLFALFLFHGETRSTTIPYGFLQVPRYVVFIMGGLTQVTGELLAFSVYVQIAAFADAMVQCCRRVNAQLVELRINIEVPEKRLKYITFRQRVLEVRKSYEGLVHLHAEYEAIFSLQIVCGVINNGLIIFASVASFFKMGESDYWYIMHALSCATFLFIIMMVSVFPIHLHEESLKSSELLQDVIYKYQMAQYSTEASEDASIDSEFRDNWAEDSFVLYGFLQRTVTKPLVISGGGFVELTRSFTISVIALIIGFTLFLLEQFEGHRQPVTCMLANSTTSLMATKLMNDSASLLVG
ncbi:hypothetical protein BV898_09857 [Hypsibius exemplaris]|uniref:Gustatory receptor n=1 Tax=Hypsibius exemplaris TaxID=2072580 RepID=A0A1W0WL50_HYPEX|nr:hypothetical protein BV898_09857 [Hypsibius exemplaris]